MGVLLNLPWEEPPRSPNPCVCTPVTAPMWSCVQQVLGSLQPDWGVWASTSSLALPILSKVDTELKRRVEALLFSKDPALPSQEPLATWFSLWQEVLPGWRAGFRVWVVAGGGGWGALHEGQDGAKGSGACRAGRDSQ